MTREGDAQGDTSDERSFVERCRDDRHHFRFIVSPKEATKMLDLKAFTRDLVADMEQDLKTKLDWVAAEHWNTDNPHVHLLVRGKAENGQNLVISRDYIGYGLRARAEELVTLELGHKNELEVRYELEREVMAEWTRLDRAIARQENDIGVIDLRPSPADHTDPELRQLMIGRLQRLERWGLATSVGPGRWTVADDAERALNDLGARRDTITVMHRALKEQGIERPIPDFVIHRPDDRPTVTGLLPVRGCTMI